MNNPKIPIAIMILTGIILILFALFPFFEIKLQHQTLHTAIVVFGAIIAIIVAVFIFYREKEHAGSKVFIISLGFLNMGLLDLIHSLYPPGNEFVFFQNTSLLLGGLYFSLVCLPQKIRNKICNEKAIWISIVVILVLVLWVIFFSESLPTMLSGEAYTSETLAINLITTILFIMAMINLLIDFYQSQKAEIYLLAFIAMVLGISRITNQDCFMWDGHWWLRHFIRLAAYTALFVYVIYGYRQMIINLKKLVDQVKKSEANLISKNEELKELYQTITLQNTEINKNAQYARNLIEASLDPLVTISPEGKITDVNEATIKVTGVSREKLIGTDFCNYFTEPEKAREGYKKVFSEGIVVDYPLTIQSISGGMTDVLYNATVYKDNSGQIAGIFAAARDVTEINKNAQYARNLIEASLDPLVTISPEGKITDVNEATIKVTGVSREKLIGTDFCNYFTEPEKAREGYKKVFFEGIVVDYPLTIQNTSGEMTDVLYNATVYKDNNGQVAGIFAAARDVTEINKVNENLKNTLVELEQSNRELEQFAYVASHDLQEPLRMVGSYVQLLARKYKGQLDQDADDFINFAVDGANRMKILINDLLTLSRIQTRSNPFVKIDMQSVLAEAIDNLGDAIEKSHAIITNDNLPEIYADKSQMVQLFQNLVGNAIKFHGENIPNVHISSKKIDNKWEFSVKDNGIGIHSDYFERIFIIFQRLHTKETYAGTGIGLSICKRILDRHDGKIWVESEPGKGSTFFFTIPETRDEK